MQASPPLVYRAIKLNIRMFRWQRALQIATSNNVHLDTVLAYRQRYLNDLGRAETDKQFQQYMQKVWDLAPGVCASSGCNATSLLCLAGGN